jgi:hypothetical protein
MIVSALMRSAKFSIKNLIFLGIKCSQNGVYLKSCFDVHSQIISRSDLILSSSPILSASGIFRPLEFSQQIIIQRMLCGCKRIGARPGEINIKSGLSQLQ